MASPRYTEIAPGCRMLFGVLFSGRRPRRRRTWPRGCGSLERSPVGCVALVIAAIGVTAGLAAAFWYGHWFTAYFCLVVSVLLWAGAGQACLAASELTLADKVWRAKCGWLGFRGSGSEFVTPQSWAIKSKAGLRAHANTDLMPWNHVVAELSDGRSVTLVRSIASRACERKLIAELRRLAGLGR